MKTEKIRALIIEDSEDDLKLMLRELNKGSYKIIYKLVENSKGLESALQEEWDVIISDYSLPGFNGNEALSMCNAKGIDIPFVVVSGTVGEDIAVEMMKSGAKDYIMKNKLARLLPAIERELADAKNRREQKQAQEALQNSEKEYRDLFYNDLTGNFITTAEGKILLCNLSFAKIYGYDSVDEIMKENALVLYQSPEERQRFINLIKDKKKLELFEEKIICRDGKEKNILENAVGEFDENNKLVLLKGYIIDITERKRAEEDLRRTNLYLDSIVENIPDMIFMKDANELRYVRFNKAGEELLGIPKQEIMGKNDYDFFSKKQADLFIEKDRAVLSSKEMRDIPEEPLQTKHQGIRIIHTKKVPILNALGEPEFLLGISEDITDRKRTEGKTQLLAHTIKSITEIITITDLEDKFTFVNQAFCDRYGYSYQEIIGQDVKILKSPNNPHELSKDILKHSRKDSWKGELLNLTKDGKEFPISLKTSKIIDENGNILGFVGIGEDITERKQAEEALRKSEGKYRVLIENMGEGIAMTDKEEKFIFVNPAAEKIFGVEQEELYGENLSMFFSNEKFKEVKKRTNERSQGKSGSFEEEIVLRDGSKKDISVTATPWFDDNKFFKGTFAIFRDITERKRAEELQKASEAKYRNLIETMPEAFYRSTAEGFFVDVNPALIELLGYDSKEELMKVYIPEELYFSKDERIEGVNYNIDFIPDSETYRLKKKDGSEIWVEDHSRYIKDSSGKVLYHEGVMRDITESLRARNAILEAKEKAEEMNRLKSSFLANMSHEIRTPLNGILGFSDIIQDEKDLEKVKKMAGIINESGNRLLNSLNQILDLSSLEANTKKADYKLTDISSIIKETIVLFSAAAQKKNLELTFESGINSLMAYSEPDLVSNTLNNLVSNAIIYTQRGNVRVLAKEEIINKKECIIIDVIDTGIGIEKENLEIIFDEFRQVSEGWGRRFEGNGLGLSLSRKYMNLLGGSISVTSKPGEGSDFKLIIPKNSFDGIRSIGFKEDKSAGISQRDSDDKKSRQKESAQKESAQKEFAQIKSEIKQKILYIEDDINCILLVKIILGNRYDIDTAKNGAEGIEKTKNNEYELILLDVNLGKDMSGLEALLEIRKIPYYKDIPVIALTAFAMRADEEEFRDAGCSEYISKPFKKEELREKVACSLLNK